MSQVEIRNAQHELRDAGRDVLDESRGDLARRPEDGVLVDVEARAVVAVEERPQRVPGPLPIVIDRDVDQSARDERVWIATSGARGVPHDRPGAWEIADGTERSHDPAVAQLSGAAQRALGVAADVEWHPRGRPDDRLLQTEELAFVDDGLAGEQLPDHPDALLEDRHSAVHRHADGQILFRTTSERHAQSQPPTREVVEGRHLAGDDGRRAQGDDEDRGAELDSARAGRRRGQEHERVEHVRVVEDPILGPHRVEAERLDLAEELHVGFARIERRDRGARHVDADRNGCGQGLAHASASSRARASRTSFVSNPSVNQP